MIHLRIVAAPEVVERALEVLDGTPSVVNVVVLPGAARKPAGDLVLCDVAREDASVVLSELRARDVHHRGSIAVEDIDVSMADVFDEAERVAQGAPGDAVVWEQVAERTHEDSTLSWSFLAFMVLAMLLTAVGIILDSSILVIGGMVVGPEFGPIAAICVALVQLRGRLASRSLAALGVGFVVAIAAGWLTMVVFREVGVTPDDFVPDDHALSRSIASPDFLAFFVAFCAGAAGTLSLSTAKSGAIVGVLISVTTIPAAANAAVAAAYGDGETVLGSLGQLGLNVLGVLAAGTLTLWLQRLLYLRRRDRLRAERERLASAVPAG